MSMDNGLHQKVRKFLNDNEATFMSACTIGDFLHMEYAIVEFIMALEATEKPTDAFK